MQITLNISDEIGQALLKQPNPELFVQKALQMMLVKEKSQQVASGGNFDDLFGVLTAPHGATLDDFDKGILQQAQEKFNDRN
jgi:hypothetical protein